MIHSLPSAFKFAEIPLHTSFSFVSKAPNIANYICRHEENQNLRSLTEFLIGAVGYAGGFVAFPLTLCLAPVSLVADLVIGVAEVAFCCYHKASLPVLCELARRKLVISPCQHLVFCITALVAPILFIAALSRGETLRLGLKNLMIPLIFWPVSYFLGQEAAIRCSNRLNPGHFSIFTNGGFLRGENQEGANGAFERARDNLLELEESQSASEGSRYSHVSNGSEA